MAALCLPAVVTAPRFKGELCLVPLEQIKIWLWACYNKIPIYPIFYLLKGDYRVIQGLEVPDHLCIWGLYLESISISWGLYLGLF